MGSRGVRVTTFLQVLNNFFLVHGPRTNGEGEGSELQVPPPFSCWHAPAENFRNSIFSRNISVALWGKPKNQQFWGFWGPMARAIWA